MKLDVYNTAKKKVGSVEVPDEVFAAEVNDAVLWEQVKAQTASRRRGTHSTKTRAEVSGGGIKPFRQKGTGRARQGSSRAPNHVGGGKVFGPKPRDYSYSLPRSARRAALRSALSMRAKESRILVLDKFELSEAKTKQAVECLERLGCPSALVVDVKNDALKLSVRNLQEAKYLAAEGINVYDVLNHQQLVLTQAALPEIIRRAQKQSQSAAASAA